MDFLFVPGNSPEETQGRTIFSQRPTTTLISLTPRQNHVNGLLAKLGAGGSITLPIGDLLFVAHGSETGYYYIPLSPTVAAPVDFEKATTADTADTVRMAPALVTPSGGGPLNTITVRLRGCNIGKARPLVEKLQKAMTPSGGALNITAPLHFDEIHHIHGGWVEYLAHKFTLKVKAPFLTAAGKSDRPALLNAFDTEGFTYLDGTAIPATSWTNWVPAQIHPPDRNWRQSFNTNVDLDPAVGTQTTVTIHREYRYEKPPFAWDWTPSDPPNDHGPAAATTEELNLLRTSLPQGTFNGNNVYDPGYPWPMWQRYGYTSLDDYVDNLNWIVTARGGTLRYRATRYDYTVMLPITDPPVPPANPALKFYNYFPMSAATGPAVLNLDETNADLFLTV
jgi:hypothetical protein